MKKIISTGLIGFGNSGQTFFAPFIEANPGFDLRKISTSDPEKAAKANQVYPGAEVVKTADDIINDPDIELVLVGSPNTSHFDLTKKALLAGKNVLVEKPFTI
ncbi:MAG: Gfo/Idh/MocA family oxidoreductase, partial [Mucilaginibacter sp.]